MLPNTGYRSNVLTAAPRGKIAAQKKRILAFYMLFDVYFDTGRLREPCGHHVSRLTNCDMPKVLLFIVYLSMALYNAYFITTRVLMFVSFQLFALTFFYTIWHREGQAIVGYT